MKAGARFIRRARHQLAKRYGRIMEITLGPRWDQEWIDEAACIVDDLAAAAGLTLGRTRGRHRDQPAISEPHAAVLAAVRADLDPDDPATRSMLTQVGIDIGANLEPTDWTVLPHRGKGRTPSPAEVSATAAWWSAALGVPVVDDPAAVVSPPAPPAGPTSYRPRG